MKRMQKEHKKVNESLKRNKSMMGHKSLRREALARNGLRINSENFALMGRIEGM